MRCYPRWAARRSWLHSTIGPWNHMDWCDINFYLLTVSQENRIVPIKTGAQILRTEWAPCLLFLPDIRPPSPMSQINDPTCQPHWPSISSLKSFGPYPCDLHVASYSTFTPPPEHSSVTNRGALNSLPRVLRITKKANSSLTKALSPLRKQRRMELPCGTVESFSFFSATNTTKICTHTSSYIFTLSPAMVLRTTTCPLLGLLHRLRPVDAGSGRLSQHLNQRLRLFN